VFITGFAVMILKARSAMGAGVPMLSKPFHLKDIVSEVNALLAAPHGTERPPAKPGA
jgi:hypothetical protein